MTHIVMIAPTHWGGFTQRQNHDRTVEVYEYIKSTIEDDGNGLYLIDLWDEPFYDSAFISGNTIQNHYSAMGYNASAMDLLDRLNDLIYANPTKFNRVDQLSTNSYIESYSNPTNWT